MSKVMILFSLGFVCLGADVMPPEADQRLAREIYKEMIESKSGFTTGTTTDIVEAVATRLKAAGFPAADVFVGGAIPRKANVVVRYRGTGARKPLLLLAHIDVVEALRADWTTDPFTLIEKDGYFYGRGTMDDKAQAAVWIANLIRYRREGFRPDRDLIVAYQMAFAVITCALVGGAVADRMKFSAFALFCALWLLLVYVPSAHWVW